MRNIDRAEERHGRKTKFKKEA